MPKQLPERFEDLGAFIRDQRSSARLSLRRLSELAGISNPYLSQIERGLRRPSAEILQQIAKALRISAETLYVQAGILEPGTGEADLSRQILADPFLSDDQKQALIRIYLSFRHENEASDHPGLRVPAPSAVRPEAEDEAEAEAEAAAGAGVGLEMGADADADPRSQTGADAHTSTVTGTATGTGPGTRAAAKAGRSRRTEGVQAAG
jgi:transcriptional regulator with XRE-family HTH domain